MGTKGIFRTNLVTLIILVVLNLAVFSLGTVVWIILGLLLLAGGIFVNFRNGMAIGHEACAITRTVNAADKDGVIPDKDYASQRWNRSTGIKGLFASALVAYIPACLYIISCVAGWGKLVLPTRIIAWILAMPYWGIVAHWHETFVELTPDIVAILMITPFILPLSTYIGYLQGPKLWKKTEEAMAQGRRRAKAKSRIVRKRTPKQQKPEI